MYLINFSITISFVFLLLSVNPPAIELDIGFTINSNALGDSVTELDVVARLPNISNDINFVDNVFLYLFLDLWFLFWTDVIISLMLLIEWLKLLTSFNFFLVLVLNYRFLMVQMGIILF